MPEVSERNDRDASPTNLHATPFQRDQFYVPIGNIHWRIIAGNVMQMKNHRIFLILVGNMMRQ
jgi:hypothetical protein